MSLITKEALNQIIRNTDTSVHQLVDQLNETTRVFPYFQIGYALLAKASYQNGTSDQALLKSKAAIYALSRIALQRLLESDPDKIDIAVYDAPDQAVASLEAGPLDNEDILIELSPQTIDKQVIDKTEEQKKQLQIIKDFIKNNPRINRQDDAGEKEFLDVSGRIAESGGGIETEAFAKILVKQGKIEKAIDLYQKLLLKNPEKRNYFAKKLSELYK